MGERFKKIKESYEYLKTYNKIDIADNTSDYMSILNKFIKLFSPSTKWNSLFMDTTFKGIVKDCENISLNIFDNISKEKSIEVYLFFKEVYPLYVQKYSYLKKLATHNILEVKIQKLK